MHIENEHTPQRLEIFVGREPELLYLESAIERAKIDGGRLVLLRGEKGIGKTRLVSELATRAAARGSCVLWGQWEYDRTSGSPRRLRVFSADSKGGKGELVLSQIAVTPDDLSGLGARIRDVCAASGLLTRGRESFPLQRALKSTFDEGSLVDCARGCLLLIDDLHSSDQLSLLLLSALMRELRSTSSLLLGVYQDNQAPEDFDSIFRYLVDEVDSLELCGLSKVEVGRLVATANGEPAEASIVHSVFEVSRGNPAMVKQVVSIANLLGAHASRLIAAPQITTASEAVDLPLREEPLTRENDAFVGENWLKREGDYWTVRLRGRVLRLRHLKGLTYIDYLIQRPGTPVHALELSALEQPAGDRDESPAGRAQDTDGSTLRQETQDDTGPMLDWQATEAYGQRLKELTEELTEATEFNDLGRISKLQEERTFIMREMSRSVGLRGRRRNGISVAERARVSVTHAIKFVIHRIRKEQPELGRLLSTAIRTGLYCSFMAEMLAESPWERPALSAAQASAVIAEPRPL